MNKEKQEEVLEQVIAMWRVEFDTIAEPEENDNGPAMGAEAQAAFERMTAHKENDND